ncbi:MAG: aldehyde ferredoxin oxidoreductase family protein [Bacillota bacterium]
MAFGYMGKYAIVDLTSKSVTIESYDRQFYRTYLGGKGFVAYHLLRQIPPGTDALSPDNVLVFATGVLASTKAPGFSRVVVGGKSPLTDGYCESEVGGSWGAQLKRAGYDGLIVRGSSASPVCILIQDEKISVEDASELWGRSVSETCVVLKGKLGKTAAVLSIGPAGEKLVRFACVMEDERDAAGRGGLGAVMGSKKLKAVAVVGSKPVPVSNAEALNKIAAWFGASFRNNAPSAALSSSGTPGLIPGLQASSMLPTRNFRAMRFEGWRELAKLGGEWKYRVSKEGCWACPIRCKLSFTIDDGALGERQIAHGPEYETIGAFGSALGIDDPLTVLKANNYCNDMGLDTISTGMTIAFAMDCVENGILRDPELLRLGVRFGNASCVMPLLEMIANRSGIGSVLAEGSLRAAKAIGGGAEKYAMQVKGQELPLHEPRGKTGVGLGYAVSDHGADHMTAPHDPLFAKPGAYGLETMECVGLTEPVSPVSLDEKKVRQYYYTNMWWDALKCLGACFFCVVPRGLMPVHMVVEAVSAATGWDFNLWELMKAGERAGCMARMFNGREGPCAPRDTLPERLFSASEDGDYPGIDREQFHAAVKLYYQMRGWDVNTGVPTKAKLAELGLDWLL